MADATLPTRREWRTPTRRPGANGGPRPTDPARMAVFDRRTRGSMKVWPGCRRWSGECDAVMWSSLQAWRRRCTPERLPVSEHDGVARIAGLGRFRSNGRQSSEAGQAEGVVVQPAELFQVGEALQDGRASDSTRRAHRRPPCVRGRRPTQTTRHAGSAPPSPPDTPGQHPRPPDTPGQHPPARQTRRVSTPQPARHAGSAVSVTRCGSGAPPAHGGARRGRRAGHRPRPGR